MEETEAAQTTANIPIDDDKLCWEKEDHARHVWGLQVDPRRLFHFLCPGVDKDFRWRMLQMECQVQSEMARIDAEAFDKRYNKEAKQ